MLNYFEYLVRYICPATNPRAEEVVSTRKIGVATCTKNVC